VTAAETLQRFIAALERAAIPYMLTGSYASSFHSIPRATRDLDFVISPTREQVLALVAALPKDEFYVDRQAALEALNSHGQFNAIDITTGWKADFIIRKPGAFSESEFNRRYRVLLDGVELSVATAEDVLVSKLKWARLGGSDRQIEDAATILRVRGNQLDLLYVSKWVQELALDQQWTAARRAAGLAE
jgi:hypothetical protein